MKIQFLGGEIDIVKQTAELNIIQLFNLINEKPNPEEELYFKYFLCENEIHNGLVAFDEAVRFCEVNLSIESANKLKAEIDKHTLYFSVRRNFISKKPEQLKCVNQSNLYLYFLDSFEVMPDAYGWFFLNDIHAHIPQSLTPEEWINTEWEREEKLEFTLFDDSGDYDDNNTLVSYVLAIKYIRRYIDHIPTVYRNAFREYFRTLAL